MRSTPVITWTMKKKSAIEPRVYQKLCLCTGTAFLDMKSMIGHTGSRLSSALLALPDSVFGGGSFSSASGGI